MKIISLLNLILYFLAAAGLTYIARLKLLKLKLLDEPERRKQHTVATVRGGGIAFVITILAFISFNYQAIALSELDTLVIAGALFLLAITGLADDFLDVSATLRILIQFAIALVVVNYIQQQSLFFITATVYIYDLPLMLLIAGGIVWSINIYNFCDGIDGYVTVEVISSCLIIAILSMILGEHNAINLLLLAIAAIMLGFLVFNWQPAAIFMGDVGSYFLGSLMVIIAILLWRYGQHYLHAWMIVQGLLVVDTSITLIRRYLARESLFKPHSSHAFQNAKRRLGADSSVIWGSLTIKLLVIAPLAYIELKYKIGFLFVFVAYIPALLLVLFFQGGVAKQHKFLNKVTGKEK